MQLTASEFIQWYKDNPPFDDPRVQMNEEMLREMESEGITFEILNTEEGFLYPHINAENWKPKIESKEDA